MDLDTERHAAPGGKDHRGRAPLEGASSATSFNVCIRWLAGPPALPGKIVPQMEEPSTWRMPAGEENEKRPLLRARNSGCDEI